MHTRLGPIFVLGLLFAAPAFGAAPSITADSYTLYSNTPGQQIHFSVTGSDLIAGEDLYFQINDGATGPKIAAIDNLTGTIFAGNNTGAKGFFIGLNGHVGGVSTTTVSDTVLDDGLFATLTVDTTGMAPGTFQIELLNTLGGSSDFVLPSSVSFMPLYPQSTFTLVAAPEPSTLFILGAAVMGVASRRRRRVVGLRR